MKRFVKILVLIGVFLTLTSRAHAQILGVKNEEHFADSLKHELELGPYFGLYKDNYFTVGTALGKKPTATNSDVKFQISLSIRLTNATLPWNTFLFLMYTQKTFWNVFENSMPMRDMNFNPGLGWTKPFFNKGRYLGKMTLLIEHESNGRDSIQSRSWNRISLSGSTIINEYLMVHNKLWIPIIDSENNRDILKYCGIWQCGFMASTSDKKFNLGVTLIKRKGWNLNFNTIVDFIWRVDKKTNLNLYAQYYNGYGENLLDYKTFKSQLRVGIVFRPKFFSEY
ncbi:MAG: phospholipase A [Clostridium sp.]|nr:phospholipase A [Prevotella sp.]MCM1429066.1 phospholipase A [Clostridium sp.]MCM1475403.1 phospholipase A [Muribaculaceae bacterium]